MADVKEHYGRVLSEFYSWMFGGFEAGVRRNAEFLKRHQFRPGGSQLAIDLGAG